jgi:hypothetical protein
MQGHHWLMMGLLLVIGYLLGVKFPQWGHSAGF